MSAHAGHEHAWDRRWPPFPPWTPAGDGVDAIQRPHLGNVIGMGEVVLHGLVPKQGADRHAGVPGGG